MSIPATPALSAELSRQLDQYFVTLGQGVNAYLHAHGRRRQIAYLDRLSDADLVELGITRDQIVHHVFRKELTR